MKPAPLARSVLGLLLVGALASACGAPVPRDASGQPAFDRTAVRHPANQPYSCFKAVDARGDKFSRCETVKASCARTLGEARGEGSSILSGCYEVDVVSCFVFYLGGNAAQREARCSETPVECAADRKHWAASVGAENVSACESLDRAFQPER